MTDSSVYEPGTEDAEGSQSEEVSADKAEPGEERAADEETDDRSADSSSSDAESGDGDSGDSDSDDDDSGDSDSGDGDSDESTDDTGVSAERPDVAPDPEQTGIEVDKAPRLNEMDEDEVEKIRQERLDPDNRPDNVEVDNTQRDFDTVQGKFEDSDIEQPNAPFADPENPNEEDDDEG